MMFIFLNKGDMEVKTILVIITSYITNKNAHKSFRVL